MIDWRPIATLRTAGLDDLDVLVCSAEKPWPDVLMARVDGGEPYTWHSPHGRLTHWAPLNMPLSPAEARGKAIAQSAMRPMGSMSGE